ncbi:MAG: response regulator [Bryobacterales bacterium]|nr:response regulator [Bryobacterales bacterium]
MANEPILVVDDNPLNLKLARLLLATENYEVRTAEHAAAALTVLETFHPRLILMDIQLPGMDGLELTRRLRADPSLDAVVILALTAYAMETDEQKALDAGCDGYIAKPLDTRSLPDVVRTYLDRQANQPRQRCPTDTQ